MAATTRAEPLLLVPGLMCDAAVWEPVIAGLGDAADCRVPDHGSALDLPTMARQVLAAAPPRFALAGHSMGARVALEVLRAAPARVTRLALLDTGVTPRPPGAAGADEARKRHALLAVARVHGVRAMAREWVRGMVHPDRLGDAALIESIVAMFERHSADVFEAQIGALLERPDASGVLAGVAVPTLVLCGRQDTWAPLAQHEAMRALAPGAVLEVIDDAGHMAPMEQPAAVAAALRRWLAR